MGPPMVSTDVERWVFMPRLRVRKVGCRWQREFQPL